MRCRILGVASGWRRTFLKNSFLSQQLREPRVQQVRPAASGLIECVECTNSARSAKLNPRLLS
jgi:hypothetical protein